MHEIVSKTTRNIGSIALIKPIMDTLQIKETVDRYCPMERNRSITHGQAVETLILNRLTSPTPLYHIEEWAIPYALQEVFGINPDQVNDDRLARALDHVHPHMQDIQTDLALTAMTKYHLAPEIVHIDTTSLYFEGEHEDSDMITLGYSRDQKPDKKQVNLALDVSADEGIPLFHTADKGNMADAKMVLKNIKKLRDKLKPSHFIIVGDRGALTSEAALMLHDAGDMDFLGALKMNCRIQSFVASVEDKGYLPVEGEPDYRVREGSIMLEHGGRQLEARAVVVWSLKKAAKDRDRRLAAVKKMEDALGEVAGKLNRGRFKRKSYVEKKVKVALAGKWGYLFKADIGEEEGKLALSWRVDAEELARLLCLDGKYVLATSLPLSATWPASRVFSTYRGRYIVESRIRNIKSELSVRPVFVHGDLRVEALVWLTVLSLLVYSVLEVLARRCGLGKVTSRTLFFFFQKIILIKLVLEGGECVNLVEDLRGFQAEVLRGLGFPLPSTLVEA